MKFDDLWRKFIMQNRRLLIGSILATSLAFACGGCANNDAGRMEISGQVTLDGQPVEQGSISFIPTAGTRGPVAGGTIVAGKYHILASQGPVVGKQRVEIRAGRRTGRQVRATDFGEEGSIDEMVESVPAKYNTSSQLVYQVKPGRNLDVDFKLTSSKQ